MNTTEGFDYQEAPPVNEMQSLYVDDAVAETLSNETARVFLKAVWVDSTRSNKLCLRVANGPALPPPADMREPQKVREYRPVEDEGDGFRSYIAVCLSLLLGRRGVCLIDEPELCLHPPQAYELGRFIGRHGDSSDRAIFVATHSSHVLRGILEGTAQLQIIRLSRAGPRFCGKRVSYDTIRGCIAKPSTKVETILDGLFAQAVTVVESEGDRLVYGTTWERLANKFHHDVHVASEFRRDVHFVSVGGIGGIADTCRLYRNLEIPVCVIADLDVLRELETFERIIRSLTSSEEAITGAINTCRRIATEIRALGPIYCVADTRRILQEILGQDLNWSNAEQLPQVRRALSDLSDGLSDTARLKRGVENLAAQSISSALRAFLAMCRRFGLFLVPCGELEDWVPSLMIGGPSRRKRLIGRTLLRIGFVRRPWGVMISGSSFGKWLNSIETKPHA